MSYSYRVPVFTIRVEDMGDHYQVYKNIPTVKTDRRGRQWIPYNDHGTDIKVGNIWKNKIEGTGEDTFDADDGMNTERLRFLKLDEAVACLLDKNK